MNYDLIVIGGGAGGFFTAIRLGEKYPGATICILEAARKPLSKVEISGGGRCNVTHACFDPQVLCTYYPRGQKELLGPFNQFQPADLMKWFQTKNVKLKTESDGRMFPVTDQSSTIINCFMNSIRRLGIQLLVSTRATKWEFEATKHTWKVKLFDGRILTSKFLLIASGSDQRTWNALKELGHSVISPVPSLFTFNILDKNLTSLQGISVPNAHLTIPGLKLDTFGPLLITHWGLSGPAILKLSAWGARELYNCGYVFDLIVNWTGEQDKKNILAWIENVVKENPKKKMINLSLKDIPSRLWKYFCSKAEIQEDMNYSEVGKKRLDNLATILCGDIYRVTGKSTFKEEFVTAGGVDLKEMDMKNFESKIQPGLFLVGEVLNIDALTGGFNFQAAWTGAELAATSIAQKLKNFSS